MNAPLIEGRGVFKSFDGREVPKGIDLRLEPG